ncbi:hypothetical protein QVD17_06189 [Tagetes erecta]|uniref:Ribosomal protein L1 n=1 Tax=Tagetes erecta TaxID=13708 RepID=A0AAD8LGF6_TARER|nr:hypothetical protein QVD17_06189 [Tagetes erecta]
MYQNCVKFLLTSSSLTKTLTMAISASTATSAVDALLRWKNKQSDSHNPQLLPQDDFIYLILTLKKIPQKGGVNGARTNPNKISLPHPIVSTTGSELCLIIDDRPNSKLTSEIAKKKIKSDDISVTKVLKLSKLRTDYKPFEAKRKLCDSYDMFFADKRVIHFLPKLLGKQFFRKKKLPLPVDLTHKNWKEQIERGCGSGLLFFSTGTCSVIRVAKVSMERDEIVENVRAAIDGVVEFVPKKLSGVRSLHLKFSDSVALPLYQTVPDIKLKIEGVGEKVGRVEEEVVGSEEVGTKKKKKAKKGRIHEVDIDMKDDEDGEVENSYLVGSELDAEDGGFDKKKRKGDGIEAGKKKRSKKGKSVVVNSDLDANEDLKEAKVAEKSVEKKKRKKVNADGILKDTKAAKKSVSEKKAKKNVVDENNVSKKKGKKQNSDSGKKDKMKGR